MPGSCRDVAPLDGSRAGGVARLFDAVLDVHDTLVNVWVPPGGQRARVAGENDERNPRANGDPVVCLTRQTLPGALQKNIEIGEVSGLGADVIQANPCFTYDKIRRADC